MCLGGGFEVVLHTDKVIFHANSVTGLVESTVGVVPGGGGVKEMLYRWSEHHGDVTKGAWDAFMNVGYGTTASSPLAAAPLHMFREGVDDYVMNRDRLLDTAIVECDFSSQKSTDSINNAALHLCFNLSGIDRNTAIDDAGDLINRQLTVYNSHFCCFGDNTSK